MNTTSQQLGVQQLLVLFIVGNRPGIMRSDVRSWFKNHKQGFEGVDRRLRELESRTLIVRKKTPLGTALTLSRTGQHAFKFYSTVFNNALSGEF